MMSNLNAEFLAQSLINGGLKSFEYQGRENHIVANILRLEITTIGVDHLLKVIAMRKGGSNKTSYRFNLTAVSNVFHIEDGFVLIHKPFFYTESMVYGESRLIFRKFPCN